MAEDSELSGILADIDTATTGIGNRLAAYAAAISTSMSQGDVTALKARLKADSLTLIGLAADPSTPVPEPAPLPPAGPAEPPTAPPTEPPAARKSRR